MWHSVPHPIKVWHSVPHPIKVWHLVPHPLSDWHGMPHPKKKRRAEAWDVEAVPVVGWRVKDLLEEDEKLSYLNQL